MATEGYNAGRAWLEIVPSFRGIDALITAEVKKWNEQIRRGLETALPEAMRAGARAAAPEGAKAGEQFGGAFAQAVRRRIEAGLKALPKVEIDADSSDTDIKIAAIRKQLEELRDKRIGIDIDEGLALAQMAALQADLDRLAHEDPSIAVRIDAARASAELAAIQAEVNHLDGQTATVNVRVNQTGAPGVGGLSGGFGLLSAGVAAAPLAAPFGAAAVGGLAGIATVAGSGAGALGVLALGLGNIKSAVQDVAAAHTAAGAAATKAGGAQLRAALAVAAAQRGVKSAEDALTQARANAADAAITAAERVQAALQAQAMAERNLTTAQQAQKDAQQALTDARKAAQQQIEDLAQAVADGQLSQRQAQLDVNKARLNLQNVNSNPLSTQLDRQQSQLDYDTAVQRQKDLATQQQRTVDAQKAAVKAGVDGSTLVVQAQKGVVAANQAVADAYTAIKNAAQGVADAQRAQVAQARQSAYAIAQAQTGVVNAMASVQSAILSASTAGNAQLAAVQAKLAALSPAALAFATFINNTLKPAFSGLRGAIQASLLPDIQAGLTAMLPLIPALSGFMSDLAKTLGGLFREASLALTSPFWQQFFRYISATAGPTIATFAHVIGDLVTGFAGLLMAFKPVSDQIGRGVLGLADAFAKWGTHLGTNSAFQSFLAYVKREGPAVARFFGDVLSITGKLLEGLAPLGAFMLDLINQVLDLTNALGPEGLLLVIGVVATAIAAFGGPVTAVVVAVTAFAGLISLIASQSPKTAVQVDRLAEAENRLTGFVENLNSELKKSIDNFTILRDGALSQERANENLQASFDAVTKSIQKNGATLSLNTEAGRENRAALTDVITALNDKVTADFKANESTMGYQKALKIASQQVAENRRRLIALAVQSGLSQKAAKGLIDQILLTPKQVATRFLTPDLAIAQSQVDHLHKSLAALRDRQWLVKMLVSTEPAPAGATDLTTLLLGGLPRKAAGGAITGPGTWTSDTAGLYRLSNGEHVWPAREVAALGGQQAMYQLRHVLTGYASGGAVDPSAGLLSVAAGLSSPGLTRLNDLAGRAAQPLHYEQHLHYPVPDSVGHGQMRAQQLLLHDLSNR